MKKHDYEIKYRCESCDKVHEDPGVAAECCSAVSTVYECTTCEEAFDSHAEVETHTCEGLAAPEWVDGKQCLCGTFLTPEDYRPSMLLGAQVLCEPCRDKLIAGMPAGEAVRRSFVERTQVTSG